MFKAEDLCRMPVIFGPSDDTASLIGNDSVIDITKWAQKILPETTVGKHNRRAICRCQLKLYHAKRKPYVNMVQKRRPCPVGQGSFKMDCFKVEKWFYGQTSPNLTFLLEITDARVLRAKEEGDLPACYQLSVQKPASLMVWGCISAYGMGSLPCFGRHYECWKVYKDFRATYAPLQTTWISAGQCKTTYCSYYNSMAS